MNDNIITCIIPDLHLQWKIADKIITSCGSDKVVFLGDYFDNWDDSPGTNREMAQWLKNSLTYNNRTHLIGNHDINYMIPSQEYKCSGYTYGKDIAINSVLTEAEWKKLELYTWVGDYLCSHAGFHKFYYNFYCNTTKKTFHEWLPEICSIAMKNAWKLNYPDPILRAGRSRGGDAQHGGIVWCDRSEFIHIDGINQIFGHTPGKKPIWMEFGSPLTHKFSKNLALDVSHAQYYAIHKNNEITIHWIGDF
jgi:hypothetical protein